MSDVKRFIRIRKVTDICGLGKSTIYDMVKHNRFPKPVRLGPKAVAWIETDVIQWQEDRIAGRGQGNWPISAS